MSRPALRRARRRLLGGALLAVTVATALGAAAFLDEPSLTRQAYAAAVGQAYVPVQTAFAETRGADGAELAARLGEAQRALENAAAALAALEPPADAQTANDRLEAGLRAYAEDLAPLRGALLAGDARAVELFNAQIASNDAIRQMTAAAAQLRASGYEIGALSGE